MSHIECFGFRIMISYFVSNYLRWEDALCELGFARRPVDDEEEEREGYVVFHKHPNN